MLTSKSHITLDIKSINQKKHAYCNAHGVHHFMKISKLDCRQEIVLKKVLTRNLDIYSKLLKFKS